MDKGEVVYRENFTEIVLQLSEFSAKHWKPALWRTGMGLENVIKEQSKYVYRYKSLWMDGARYNGPHLYHWVLG